MKNILIISARFYTDISDELENGAKQALTKLGHKFEVVEVPGAFEIPAVIKLASHSGRYDGYVALGCVIRGETTHYDYVCLESARGLNELAIKDELAIGYGILTVENDEQAWARAKISEGNKGKAAVEACIRMIELKEKFSG
jgi:6,7-dimethyl-8-ribityllumazine synthase